MKTPQHESFLGADGIAVVGVISEPETLRSAPTRSDWPCDIVEVRLDLLGMTAVPDWLSLCSAIEKAGKPVLLTLRTAREGGKWDQSDEARLPHLVQALSALSAIDVEFVSPIREELCNVAQQQGKTVVVSFHDFEHTPPQTDLQRIVDDASASAAAIPKLATMVTDPADIERLEQLLQSNAAGPICVIGMGDMGAENAAIDVHFIQHDEA